jgi:hypothetical protein
MVAGAVLLAFVPLAFELFAENRALLQLKHRIFSNKMAMVGWRLLAKNNMLAPLDSYRQSIAHSSRGNLESYRRYLQKALRKIATKVITFLGSGVLRLVRRELRC